MPHLAHIALVVRDYDEALAFYVGKFGFELVEDKVVGASAPADAQGPRDLSPAHDKPLGSTGAEGKRWVTIRPPNAPPHATTILLARASTDHQAEYIGDQAGGRVFHSWLRHHPVMASRRRLATDDFARDHARFTAAGVEWVRRPADHDYGRVVVWKDLYGNLWNLVQFAPGHPAA